MVDLVISLGAWLQAHPEVAGLVFVLSIAVILAIGVPGGNILMLSRRLKANNTTAQKEIDKLRRDKALNALSESALPIREIAAMVGYENPVVFSRAFKRWTGQLPSELRKKSRDQAVKKRGDRPEWALG